MNTIKKKGFISALANLITNDVVFKTTVFLIYIFLLMPVIITFVTAVNPASALTFPPKGISLKWFQVVLSDREWLYSYNVSLFTSTVASLVAMISGTLYAFCYVRFRFFAKEAMNVFAISPLAFPKIILGVAILIFFNILRLVGTFTGLILGLIIVAAPFVVKTVTASMYNFDKSIEEAAMNLGANEVQTFLKITLPLIKPGLISAAILSFIYTFGNLQVAIFLVGPTTITIPVRLFASLEFSDDPSIAAVAAINILIVMLFLFIAQRYLGIKALVKL